MKLIVKELLALENLSVRALAERIPESGPSYRTVDEFIRRGGGTLATAVPIAKALGKTLNDIYVEDDYKVETAAANDEQKKVSKAIADIVAICTAPNIEISKEILSKIAVALGNNGFDDESTKCFERAGELV